MEYKKKYEEWITNRFFDLETQNELVALTDEKEIEDRFYREIKFGTGGMRALIGAGTNRINKYTVGKVTDGFSNWLQQKYDKKTLKQRGVIVAFDTRFNSEMLARVVASVLSNKNISVFLYSIPCPTPQLGFSVLTRNALAGIVITASHNSKEYNGYKIYDQNGSQIAPEVVNEILPYIEKINDYTKINFNFNKDNIFYIDDINSFVNAVLKESRIKDFEIKNRLKIVYSPLHGTGILPIKNALIKDGFLNLSIVKEQEQWDGRFPTVKSPNPENSESMKLALKSAERINADIVLATDPDADRIGVAVMNSLGNYQLLSGNQIGALLIDFLLKHTNLQTLKKPAIMKTIVSSELASKIAKEKGITVFTTLTGFKYTGEKINQFEKAKIENDSLRNYDFLFSYEESLGYLTGFHTRDKDAIVSALLICEMAAELKNKGKTLLDAIEELYIKYGYYYDRQDNYVLEGKEGLEVIDKFMKNLRRTNPFKNVDRIIDYSGNVKAEPGFGFLPKSNVLKYIYSNKSWVVIRPSGTEPKLKIYYSILGENKEDAIQMFEKIHAEISNYLYSVGINKTKEK